jgi:hypothetical protein
VKQPRLLKYLERRLVKGIWRWQRQRAAHSGRASVFFKGGGVKQVLRDCVQVLDWRWVEEAGGDVTVTSTVKRGSGGRTPDALRAASLR